MNYYEAKQHKANLEAAVSKASFAINVIDCVALAAGFVPAEIRATTEFKLAKADYDKAFANLQAFNRFFVKEFKKEYTAERRAKWSK